MKQSTVPPADRETALQIAERVREHNYSDEHEMLKRLAAAVLSEREQDEKCVFRKPNNDLCGLLRTADVHDIAGYMMAGHEFKSESDK